MMRAKDFKKISSKDVLSLNISYKEMDNVLQEKLFALHKEMIKHCFDNPNAEKFWEAQNKYNIVLKEKAENKQEWMILEKVAKQRHISL